jgi:hypothetical protein
VPPDEAKRPFAQGTPIDDNSTITRSSARSHQLRQSRVDPRQHWRVEPDCETIRFASVSR